jgi:hypothetical protein
MEFCMQFCVLLHRLMCIYWSWVWVWVHCHFWQMSNLFLLLLSYFLSSSLLLESNREVASERYNSYAIYAATLIESTVQFLCNICLATLIESTCTILVQFVQQFWLHLLVQFLCNMCSNSDWIYLYNFCAICAAILIESICIILVQYVQQLWLNLLVQVLVLYVEQLYLVTLLVNRVIRWRNMLLPLIKCMAINLFWSMSNINFVTSHSLDLSTCNLARLDRRSKLPWVVTISCFVNKILRHTRGHATKQIHHSRNANSLTSELQQSAALSLRLWANLRGHAMKQGSPQQEGQQFDIWASLQMSFVIL